MALYDSSLLEAALVGYQAQKQQIEQAIADLQYKLGKAPKRATKHRISPEGLKRIREAQKRRWAKAKK